MKDLKWVRTEKGIRLIKKSEKKEDKGWNKSFGPVTKGRKSYFS